MPRNRYTVSIHKAAQVQVARQVKELDLIQRTLRTEWEASHLETPEPEVKVRRRVRRVQMRLHKTRRSQPAEASRS